MKISNFRKNLLVVEDDPELSSLLGSILEPHYDLHFATNGNCALTALQTKQPDLILMDIQMPHLDGVSALKMIRKEAGTRHLPVIMLTGSDSSKERINAYHAGADDFISKPFDTDELLARVETRLSRIKQQTTTPQTFIEISNLQMNVTSREVRVAGSLLVLRPTEFEILHLLLSNLGQLVSRQQIIECTWKNGKTPDERRLDAHIVSLRKKIREFNGEIKTVYGSGYRLTLN